MKQNKIFICSVNFISMLFFQINGVFLHETTTLPGNPLNFSQTELSITIDLYISIFINISHLFLLTLCIISELISGLLQKTLNLQLVSDDNNLCCV